jgi:hypothetical protein
MMAHEFREFAEMLGLDPAVIFVILLVILIVRLDREK